VRGHAGRRDSSVAPTGHSRSRETSCVSSLAAAYVLQAAVGLISFTDEQKLAGDVSGNGALSSLDAALILQYKVGLIADLPVALTCGSDWAFMPVPVALPGQSMVSPLISPGSCTMGSITYDPLSTNASNQGYLGIAFGDVTGNWQPGQSVVQPVVQVAQQAQVAPPKVRALAPRMRPSGKMEVAVQVQSEEPYRSLDVELRYDPAQLRAVRGRKLRASRGVMVASNVKEEGRIIVSLAGLHPLDSKAGVPVAVVFEAPSGRLSKHALRLKHAEVDGRDALGQSSHD
jgi:hypothetical protein